MRFLGEKGPRSTGGGRDQEKGVLFVSLRQEERKSRSWCIKKGETPCDECAEKGEGVVQSSRGEGEELWGR